MSEFEFVYLDSADEDDFFNLSDSSSSFDEHQSTTKKNSNDVICIADVEESSCELMICPIYEHSDVDKTENEKEIISNGEEGANELCNVSNMEAQRSRSDLNQQSEPLKVIYRPNDVKVMTTRLTESEINEATIGNASTGMVGMTISDCLNKPDSGFDENKQLIREESEEQKAKNNKEVAEDNAEINKSEACNLLTKAFECRHSNENIKTSDSSHSFEGSANGVKLKNCGNENIYKKNQCENEAKSSDKKTNEIIFSDSDTDGSDLNKFNEVCPQKKSILFRIYGKSHSNTDSNFEGNSKRGGKKSEAIIVPKDAQQRRVSRNKKSQVTDLNDNDNKCHICNKVFSTKMYARKHIRVYHEKESKYKCDECVICFRFKKEYMEHIKSVHAKSKDVECKICGKMFTTKHSLYYHTRRFHSLQNCFQCNICGKKFKRNSYLEKHTKKAEYRVKLFVCKKCNSSFRNETAFKGHCKDNHN